MYDYGNNTAQGSPPRMRGKETWTRPMPIYSRITPAYAGKSTPPSAFRLSRWDHPRVCGEKSLAYGLWYAKLGSPPRVRGKAQRHAGLLLPAGITPACAGKRRSIGRLSQPTRDHPRVCGEKALSTFSSRKNSGSPPRMRGKVDLSLKVVRVLGITPAYAGKRSHTHPYSQ